MDGLPRDLLVFLHSLSDTRNPEDLLDRFIEGLNSIQRRITIRHAEPDEGFTVRTEDGDIGRLVIDGSPTDADRISIDAAVGLLAVFFEKRDRERLLADGTMRLRKTVQDLEDALERLEDATREIEAFTFSISHDLRAPLRGIQGFADALVAEEQESVSDEGLVLAERIRAAANRMERLIDDLLAYSHISRSDKAAAPVDLGLAIREAIEALAAEIAERDAEIEVADDLPMVIGAPTLLRQVVQNLIGNAIKFTAPDVRPKVKVHAESKGDSVRLWVEDNGIGIDVADQERIFGIFQRLHGVESYPGTGIGLAIARKAVRRMNGNIGVRSAPGAGSSFRVDLGKAPDAEPAD
jgi:signal transduction histidine kinase